RYRRCLIPASGFYEWQRQDRGRKQSYAIVRKDGQPFAFAGLWEQWTAPGGEAIESCTILTTAANALVQPIHERMPVILPQREYDRWLDNRVQQMDLVTPLLRPLPTDELRA